MNSTNPPRAELLLCATLWLLAKGASRNACPRQLRAIRQHLEMLAAHPGMSTMVRDICRDLALGQAANHVHRPRQTQLHCDPKPQ